MESVQPIDLPLMSIGARLGPDLRQRAPHLRLTPGGADLCGLQVVDGFDNALSKAELVPADELRRLLRGQSLMRDGISIQPTPDGATVLYLDGDGFSHEAMVESEHLQAWLDAWSRHMQP